MFKESIFEGACATATFEVLLIITGSLLLGLILGYLIWGWLKRKVSELEGRLIDLNRKVKAQEAEIADLTSQNEELSSDLAKTKRNLDLKSVQHTSAISRIKSLEAEEEKKKPSKPVAKAKPDLPESGQGEITDPEEIKSTARDMLAEHEKQLKKTKSDVADAGKDLKADDIAVSGIAPVAAKPVKRGRPKKVKDTPEVTKEPKRRGRPPKAKVEEPKTEAPKRRGRPKKVKTDEAIIPVAPKRRGRPPKAKAEEPKAEAPKRRGRPKKVKTEEAVIPLAPKRRGRPPKVKSEEPKPVAPKRRGRPPKVKAEEPKKEAPKRRGRPPKAKTEPVVPAAPKKRGRPKGAKNKPKVLETAAPKRRGRPPKAKTEPVTPVEPKRRGRPKGSKNKPKPALVLAQASTIMGFRVRQDDLTVVEGIGPKLSDLLQNNRVKTWKKLSESKVGDLRTIVEKIGPRHHIHDPSTWARQARMADRGEWKKLKTYQDTLIRGRK